MVRTIICSLALLLLAPQAQAQCPGGQCPVGASATVSAGPRVALRLPGRPVARTAKAAAVVVRGAAKVAVAPMKAASKVFKRQPVRRVLRAAAKVVTGQGPLMQRVRSRSCH